MALQLVTFSMTIEDADGERFSMPLYGLFNDAVATLANLTAYLQTLAEDVNAVIDGAIVKASFSMGLDTSGWDLRASPVSGSEIERTGLISFNLESSPYSYGVDIPAFAEGFFVGNAIDQEGTEVAALIAQLEAVSSTFQACEPVSGKSFVEVRSARKTFRKHRKSTKRS
jgi:hypothetical protein